MNFLELVKARYSVRNYEERPIEQNKLDYIMECVRLAPSAVNFQPCMGHRTKRILRIERKEYQTY